MRLNLIAVESEAQLLRGTHPSELWDLITYTEQEMIKVIAPKVWDNLRIVRNAALHVLFANMK